VLTPLLHIFVEEIGLFIASTQAKNALLRVLRKLIFREPLNDRQKDRSALSLYD
jgi:hypothetical protein